MINAECGTSNVHKRVVTFVTKYTRKRCDHRKKKSFWNETGIARPFWLKMIENVSITRSDKFWGPAVSWYFANCEDLIAFLQCITYDRIAIENLSLIQKISVCVTVQVIKYDYWCALLYKEFTEYAVWQVITLVQIVWSPGRSHDP